ncbi:hypothetical protein [Ruminococcus albus]|uniref:Uncharacterized protein n=1 Tax=Ruminococcus albus (strain ATCC 27210 / DSM 20455 / JCM 14654 / NCDO 2250 / 7) TaxID=697329 RepID=E6UJZ0_RUMA7|nr:hypothetical protein [Ruminococcus albus]ADU23986.1 hypothetical protein Rumal_3544 [Ruminococcus albus 7 = DSM 20455]
MKKMLLMLAVIIPISLIFNGQDFWSAFAERRFGESEECFDVLFFCNAFGFIYLQNSSLEYMLYTLTVCVPFLFMFGHTMSDNLNVSDIYVFIRENKRTKWFMKNTIRIFWQSTIITLANIAIIWSMTAKTAIIKKPENLEKILWIAVLMIIYIWILIIASNFLSALFGSTIGLALGSALHYVFVMAARYGFENNFIKKVDPLAVVFNVVEDRENVVTAVSTMIVILAIVCAIFCLYVNKSDISLKNKEIIV